MTGKTFKGICTFVPVFVLAVILAGCGGGGGGAPAPQTAASGHGSGKIAAAVSLTGRVAGRAVAQTGAGTVTVDLTVTGYYSEDGEEFPPVESTVEIDLAAGGGRASLLDVPTGVNHILTVEAYWGSATETVRAIVPEVVKDETTTVAANERSTIIADTALARAEDREITLDQLEPEEISAIESAVDVLSENGIAYSAMTAASVLEYMGASGVCGNGVTEAGETCDDGNTETEACAYGETSCTVCHATCQSTDGAVSYCGDGSIDTANSETCDDGADNGSPNFCTDTCTGTVPATCGNGVLESGETCDDGNTVTEACAYGETSCTVCDGSCNQAPGAVSYCGDGSIDSPGGETCDDGNTVTEACAYGETSCTVCDGSCNQAPGAVSYCGDENIDSASGEICDDGVYNGMPEACNSTCDGYSFPECGNGIIEGQESCDDGNLVTETCAYGEQSCYVCDSSCFDAPGDTSYCGDYIVDSGNGETCDDGAGNGAPGSCNVTCDGIEALGDLPYIDGGAYMTCGITAAGAAKCWGSGGSGQLGNGATSNSPTPVQVTGLTSGVVDISSGGAVCAVLDTGALMCWGYNGYGAVGDGTTTNRTTPTAVSGLSSGVTQVGNGPYHSCAVVNGGVKCWGYNAFGEVGDGTTTQRNTPVDVTGLTTGMSEVHCGNYFCCARHDAGTVSCWGRGSNGQLGNGATADSSTPVSVTGLTGVTQLAVDTESSHACALTGGGMKCWGANANGQLGNGTTTDSNVPVDVTGLTTGVVGLGIGGTHSCAITSTGGLKCWGRNDYGMVGDATTTQRLTPVDVSGMTTGVDLVMPGRFHTCARKTDDSFWCWGWNQYGEIGDGTTTTASSPSAVVGF